MQRSEVLDRLRAFIADNFLYMRPDFQLGDDDSLMGKGVVDSMGVMEMLEFLSAEFGVVVDENDVTHEKIGTLNAIATYVLAHQPEAGRQIA